MQGDSISVEITVPDWDSYSLFGAKKFKYYIYYENDETNEQTIMLNLLVWYIILLFHFKINTFQDIMDLLEVLMTLMHNHGYEADQIGNGENYYIGFWKKMFFLK